MMVGEGRWEENRGGAQGSNKLIELQGRHGGGEGEPRE